MCAISITGKIPPYKSDFISKSRSIATFTEGSMLSVLYLPTSADQSQLKMLYRIGEVLWRKCTLSIPLPVPISAEDLHQPTSSRLGFLFPSPTGDTRAILTRLEQHLHEII